MISGSKATSLCQKVHVRPLKIPNDNLQHFFFMPAESRLGGGVIFFFDSEHSLDELKKIFYLELYRILS